MFIAVRTGLEPVTPCVTGMYSNQLNYTIEKALFFETFFSDTSRKKRTRVLSCQKIKGADKLYVMNISISIIIRYFCNVKLVIRKVYQYEGSHHKI